MLFPILLVALLLPSLANAEIKIIISESIYTMGDGVLSRFCGHLNKAHNGPGGCHDTTEAVFSRVQT